MSEALYHYMATLKKYLDMDGIAEICINKPGELWVEHKGTFKQFKDDALTETSLRLFAELVAEYNEKELSLDKPLLGATLPKGERVQFVLNPGCEKGQFICAIRKPNVMDFTLADWQKMGAFNHVKKKKNTQSKQRKILSQLYKAKSWMEFIHQAVQFKQNILISGGTSSAKTTFLNTVLKSIGENERIITIEDAREVKPLQPNCAHLLSNGNSPSHISMLDLLKATLRLRPDRIFLSEIRGAEAYPFLRASISGHPGSLTTLHADNVESAKEQLMFMLSEAPELSHASEARLKSIISQSVDVIIQMNKAEGGLRILEDVCYLRYDKECLNESYA